MPELKEVRRGAKVRGKLVAIGDEHGMVDFGGRSEGVIETRHLKDEAGNPKHAVGDELDLFVLDAGDQIVLGPSMKAEASGALQQIRAAQAAGVPVTGRVTRKNAGGLEVDLSGVRGFCPVSQIELGFCADASVHVGKTYDFLVTQIKDARSVVVSRRTLLQRAEQEAAKTLLATLKPGDEVEGTVARLEAFGAFVNLGGMDGLVHVSEIRHDRVGHPKEALSVGEKVRARVLRLDHGKDGRPRIALSIKAATPDPVDRRRERFSRGMRVTGTVVRLAEFGAFVNLAPGIDGLVHITEAASHPVSHVKDVLKVGQQVEAMVLGVDSAKKRIALSLRESAGEPEADARRPQSGDKVSGIVAGVKPFGVFVDLPDYGRRARGLVPREETGAPRDADLEQRFTVGTAVEVEVLDARDQRIRLSMRTAEERAAARESQAGAGEHTARPAGERSALGLGYVPNVRYVPGGSMFAHPLGEGAELRPLEPWQAAEFAAYLEGVRRTSPPGCRGPAGSPPSRLLRSGCSGTPTRRRGTPAGSTESGSTGRSSVVRCSARSTRCREVASSACGSRPRRRAVGWSPVRWRR